MIPRKAEELGEFIADLLGKLRAYEVPQDRAVKICQDIESFISRKLAQAREEGAREEREKIKTWLFENGITHKESAQALQRFLKALSQQDV